MNFSLLDDVADSDLSSTQRLILFMLLKYANERNEAWPSQETLALKTGLTRRAIVKNLSVLECFGWVNRNHKSGRGHFYMIKKPVKKATSIVIVVHNENGTNGESNVNDVPSNVNDVPSNVNDVPSNVNDVPPNYQEQPITKQEQPVETPPAAKPEKPKGKRERKPRLELQPTELPFGSSEFSEHWQEWVNYRSEIRKPITETMRKAQFRKFQKWGEADSIESIENSISNGWQGLFAPDKSKNRGKSDDQSDFRM